MAESSSDHVASYTTNATVSGSNSTYSTAISTSSLTVGTHIPVHFKNSRDIMTVTGINSDIMILIVGLIVIVLLLIFNHALPIRKKDKAEEAVDAMKRASKKAEELGIPEMTVDEIDEEISKARKERTDKDDLSVIEKRM